MTKDCYNDSDSLFIKKNNDIWGRCGKRGRYKATSQLAYEAQCKDRYFAHLWMGLVCQGHPKTCKVLEGLLIDIPEFSLSYSDTWKIILWTVSNRLWWHNKDAIRISQHRNQDTCCMNQRQGLKYTSSFMSANFPADIWEQG